MMFNSTCPHLRLHPCPATDLHLLRFEALLFAFFKLWIQRRFGVVLFGHWIAVFGGMELNQEFSDMNLNLLKLKGLSFSQTLINHDKSLRQIISDLGQKNSNQQTERLSSDLVSIEDFHPGNVHLARQRRLPGKTPQKKRQNANPVMAGSK